MSSGSVSYIFNTITLARLKNIIHYTEDFIIQRFIKSRFRSSSCIFDIMTYF